MAKKNTKKTNKKEPVKAVIVPEMEDINIGDTVEVDLTLVDKDAGIPSSIDFVIKRDEDIITIEPHSGDFKTIDGQAEYTNGESNVVPSATNMRDIGTLTFTELHGMKKCLDVLNQHYLNLREMNCNYDAASYNDARYKLGILKTYETALYKVIENKIFDIKL